MTTTSRVEQRDHLLTMFGMLVGSIRELLWTPGDPTPRLPYVHARFLDDSERFHIEVDKLCHADPLHYTVESQETYRACVIAFSGLLMEVRNGKRVEDARKDFERCCRHCEKLIRSIPTDDPDTILPGLSPVATYVRLRAECQAATQRVQLFDPWLDQNVFHRYIVEIPTSVDIVIVTSDKIMQDPRRRDPIVAVSELVSVERPAAYRFLVSDRQQHDRYLRVDGKILHLGGSLKDASKASPYTIGKLDPTLGNHGVLDDIMETATEWFGKTVTVHRRG
jgi:hypothetical protein